MRSSQCGWDLAECGGNLRECGWDLASVDEIYTANNFGLLYSWKRISQNSFPNFFYIFPKSFMIFCPNNSNPDLNPPDPHVFRPPGSGSISQRYGSGFWSRSGSGSGSLYHQAKIIRKTLIPTALCLLLYSVIHTCKKLAHIIKMSALYQYICTLIKCQHFIEIFWHYWNFGFPVVKKKKCWRFIEMLALS
jgi:hypothetical protein